MTKQITLTETIEQMDIWIEDIQCDLQKDWVEEKPLLHIQLQQLLIAKANLEAIFKSGGINS